MLSLGLFPALQTPVSNACVTSAREVWSTAHLHVSEAQLLTFAPSPAPPEVSPPQLRKTQFFQLLRTKALVAIFSHTPHPVCSKSFQLYFQNTYRIGPQNFPHFYCHLPNPSHQQDFPDVCNSLQRACFLLVGPPLAQAVPWCKLEKDAPLHTLIPFCQNDVEINV